MYQIIEVLGTLPRVRPDIIMFELSSVLDPKEMTQIYTFAKLRPLIIALIIQLKYMQDDFFLYNTMALLFTRLATYIAF